MHEDSPWAVPDAAPSSVNITSASEPVGVVLILIQEYALSHSPPGCLDFSERAIMLPHVVKNSSALLNGREWSFMRIQEAAWGIIAHFFL